MTETKTLTNFEIFNLANLLLENFNSNENFPVKIGFYLQKNTNAIIELAKNIEESRLTIIRKFGELAEDGSEQYNIKPENVDNANKELNDLFTLTQDVSLNMLKLDWFDGIELTNNQVKAISLMITEE